MYTPTESKSNYTPTENGTGIGGSTIYTNYCVDRLPCGLCRLTNSICPLSGGEWKPTWGTPTCGMQTWGTYCTAGTVMKENGRCRDTLI